jgi:hypothetical protein
MPTSNSKAVNVDGTEVIITLEKDNSVNILIALPEEDRRYTVFSGTRSEENGKRMYNYWLNNYKELVKPYMNL